jgi:hypothetical protein
MKNTELWKNFNLGLELNVSGAFIYNGLRRFNEIDDLNYTEDIFEVLYNLSVGLERLLKIAVILLEHNETGDQEEFEKSLITHSHLELICRVKKKTEINLGTQHNEFLGLLGKFYKSHRYGRFNIASIQSSDKERDELCGFLAKHLNVEIDPATTWYGTNNDPRYRDFLQRIVTKISITLYKTVEKTASKLNLYTYELRSGSKAQMVFYGRASGLSEEILWKELLVFFMNTKSTSAALDLLREIEPLNLDPELADEYLECFRSNATKLSVIEEIEERYSELKNKRERIESIKLIGDPNISLESFDPDEIQES